MRRAGVVLGASVLVVAMVAATTRAWAAAGDDAGARREAPQRGFVDVAVAASPEEAAALLDTVRELVARQGLGLRATTGDGPPWTRLDAPPDAPGQRARVWIEAHDPAAVSVDVCALVEGAPAGAPRRILHRVVPREGSSAVVVDTVGHVVEATLESALLEPAPPPAAPPVPPTLPPPPLADVRDTSPARASPRRGGLALDVAAFADGADVAHRSGVALGGGGSFIVSAGPIPWRPSLWIGASFQTPFNIPGPGVTLQTTVTSFRAMPAVEFLRVRPLLQLDLAAGAGADLYRDTPENPHGPFPTSTQTQMHATPVVAGQLLARLRLGPSARLLVGLDLDWDPGPHHYTVVDCFGNPSAVLEPATLRPGALVGICVPLTGGSACGGE